MFYAKISRSEYAMQFLGRKSTHARVARPGHPEPLRNPGRAAGVYPKFLWEFLASRQMAQDSTLIVVSTPAT
jgi:hypothetical protein